VVAWADTGGEVHPARHLRRPGGICKQARTSIVTTVCFNTKLMLRYGCSCKCLSLHSVPYLPGHSQALALQYQSEMPRQAACTASKQHLKKAHPIPSNLCD
jgi:hypothetical protein